MKDLDQILKDNRLDIEIYHDFRGICNWNIAITANNIGQEPKIVHFGQFTGYKEMREDLNRFLKGYSK